MNVLECHIKEIKKVEPYEAEWTKELNKKFVKVRVVTNCYGSISESETIVEAEEWEEIKKRGYFLW